jgi:hypothetical protein
MLVTSPKALATSPPSTIEGSSDTTTEIVSTTTIAVAQVPTSAPTLAPTCAPVPITPTSKKSSLDSAYAAEIEKPEQKPMGTPVTLSPITTDSN